MPSQELIATVQETIKKVSASAEEYAVVVGSVQQFIVDHFGQTGLYAAYISLASLGLLIAWKLAKLSFSALKYMVVPSVALAFMGSVFLPYTFVSLLPVTVTGCSLFLLFKG